MSSPKSLLTEMLQPQRTRIRRDYLGLDVCRLPSAHMPHRRQHEPHRRRPEDDPTAQIVGGISNQIDEDHCSKLNAQYRSHSSASSSITTAKMWHNPLLFYPADLLSGDKPKTLAGRHLQGASSDSGTNAFPRGFLLPIFIRTAQEIFVNSYR
jgi:hypothetical protein